MIQLQPVFKHCIWGGAKLRTEFLYEVEGDDIGECWGISAHPNGDCTVLDGTYKGKKLSELWRDKKEVFGETNKETFPLLVKIIDAKKDLSIQVHPNDAYAKEHEHGSLGKTECWYILDCDENAKLVVGHNATSKKELCDMIHEGRWKELIREVPIKKGDFIQIDPGTVHAIKGGTLILETQQNSDITYRLYDYDRTVDGKLRPLHLEQSIETITVPAKASKDSVLSTEGMKKNVKNKLIQTDYYSVFFVNVSGEMSFSQKGEYYLCSVISGEGKLNGMKLTKGMHFILTAQNREIELSGELAIMMSTDKE